MDLSQWTKTFFKRALKKQNYEKFSLDNFFLYKYKLIHKLPKQWDVSESL